jgi:hypothetical protein
MAALLASESKCLLTACMQKKYDANDKNYFISILIFDSEIPPKCGEIPSTERKGQGQHREKN